MQFSFVTLADARAWEIDRLHHVDSLINESNHHFPLPILKVTWFIFIVIIRLHQSIQLNGLLVYRDNIHQFLSYISTECDIKIDMVFMPLTRLTLSFIKFVCYYCCCCVLLIFVFVSVLLFCLFASQYCCWQTPHTQQFCELFNL